MADKKIKLLFQGDSITDAGRDKRNYHDVGPGYPKYASEILTEKHPEIDFEFINFGISGNRTDQLFDRIYADGIAFQPDIISFLIGINDIWHRKNNIFTTDEQFALNYRTILKLIKEKTNAKIVMMAPFVLDAEDKDWLRADLVNILPIVHELAEEFADAYIRLDLLFEEAMKTQPEPLYYSADGVHPNENGRKFIGEIYAETVAKLLK